MPQIWQEKRLQAFSDIKDHLFVFNVCVGFPPLKSSEGLLQFLPKQQCTLSFLASVLYFHCTPAPEQLPEIKPWHRQRNSFALVTTFWTSTHGKCQNKCSIISNLLSCYLFLIEYLLRRQRSLYSKLQPLFFYILFLSGMSKEPEEKHHLSLSKSRPGDSYMFGYG